MYEWLIGWKVKQEEGGGRGERAVLRDGDARCSFLVCSLLWFCFASFFFLSCGDIAEDS